MAETVPRSHWICPRSKDCLGPATGAGPSLDTVWIGARCLRCRSEGPLRRGGTPEGALGQRVSCSDWTDQPSHTKGLEASIGLQRPRQASIPCAASGAWLHEARALSGAGHRGLTPNTSKGGSRRATGDGRAEALPHGWQRRTERTGPSAPLGALQTWQRMACSWS